MSGYVRKIEITVPFDGREVKLSLKPLQRGDLFKLQALLPEKVKANPAAAGESDAGPAFEFYSDRLREYVIDADVVDAAGAKVPVEEWTSVSYFIPLVGTVMQEHMAKATPTNPLSSAVLAAESSNLESTPSGT